MRELSTHETTKVNGGMGPLAGGAFGVITYAAGNFVTGQDSSWAGAASAFTMGAVTSGLSGLANGVKIAAAGKRALELHSAGIGVLSSGAVYNMVSGSGNLGGTASTGSHILDKHK